MIDANVLHYSKIVCLWGERKKLISEIATYKNWLSFDPDITQRSWAYYGGVAESSLSSSQRQVKEIDEELNDLVYYISQNDPQKQLGT